MATALALGRDFLGTISDAVTVLYWACEDESDEIWRRQVDICRYFKVPMEQLSGKLVVYSGVGLDNTLFAMSNGVLQPTRLFGELEAQIHDHGAQVLILDNVGQVYAGSENERHPVTTFINMLHGAHRGQPEADLLLSHPAKQAGSEFSGSTAWENAVRMRLLLTHALPDQRPDSDTPVDPAVRFLSKRKANYSGHDSREFRYSNGVLVPSALELPNLAPGVADRGRKIRAQTVVLEAINQLTEKNITASDAPGQAFLPSQVLKYDLAQGCTKKELGDAMRKLIMNGKIRKDVTGKYANGSKRTGLVVVGD
jgi:hypothetical protein